MKKRKKQNIFGSIWFAVVLSLLLMWNMEQNVEAALADNPYITWSPDGNAFTTNADETDTEWYEFGYTIHTGEVSSLRAPREGEHLYDVIRKERVCVGKWVVQHTQGCCIHGRYTEDNYFYGVSFGKNKCFRDYYSGWMAYCADCGQSVVDNLFYMSDHAAASINELDMTLAYYYRCPWCTNLEQGTELKQHICKEISYNQYSVRYHANFGKGYMPKSVHMYNNAVFYEGNEVVPQTNLTLNSYTRVGYEFAGWNTKMDGTGISYTDGQEIYNLCTEEQESIILYAQWEKSQSVLSIDPNGGRYHGFAGVCNISGLYDNTYELHGDSIEAPVGATVHFDTNGGATVPDITGKQEFAGWSFKQPMHGSFRDNVYTYKGKDGTVDYVTATYCPKAIVLPEPYKEGYSFGGWYYDEEGTRIAGAAGDEFLPAKEITLYAYWVDLRLTSEDNYIANSGKGSVNLAWEQKDNLDKTYLIYQKRENGAWQKIHSAEEVSTEKYVSKSCEYTGASGSYTIPYTGFYRLTLQGAQGGSYGSFCGGMGGEVSAVIYLEKGEKLEYVVGGQNGYHGGGTGSAYGNGGGYSSVSTTDRGIILIAGGGGGATAQSNGYAGGSHLGNIAGNQGENGMAGGGGGYQGGAGGNVITHNHTSSCKHVHSGNSTVYGGCYTVAETCNNTSFEEEIYKETFYYGNKDDDGNHVYCVRCGSYECPGHHDVFYKYRCTLCDTYYKDNAPGMCTALKKYGTGCGKTQEYICGYQENQMIGSTPAYGGSNYVKEEECLTYQEKQGVRAGNGSLLIEAVRIGFREENNLKGVKATDCAAPDKINMDTVEIKGVDANKINVLFAQPQDKGTVYYHFAESYRKSTGQKLSTSNQTVNTLTSGIYGYRYCLDQQSDTTITNQDTRYISSGIEPYISVTVADTKQYLHIAAEDKAGNLSETIHIPIFSAEGIFWPVITEQMWLKKEANVFKATQDAAGKSEKTYYVKADGTTPFTISFLGRLCGTAQSGYQINQLHFLAQDISHNGEEGKLMILAPMETAVGAGSCTYLGDVIRKQYENIFCMEEAAFTQVRRSDYCKQLDITQAFKLTADMDGHKIRLTPQAGVITDQVQVISDKQQDLANSIYVLADGQGPHITGLDLPENIPGKDVGSTIWEYTLQVQAVDSGSGLKEFRLEIRNKDNGGYEVIKDTDGDGCIILQMSSENALFWGHFTILACATDNVGNESAETYGMDGISVTAYIEKTMSPQTNVYKKGESGSLYIQTTGYAERMEVIFPEVWKEQNRMLDKLFVYGSSDFLQTEKVTFMVPLQVPEGDYQIIVRAYKDEKVVEARPELVAVKVSGSILDEIRTRLR